MKFEKKEEDLESIIFFFKKKTQGASLCTHEQ